MIKYCCKGRAHFNCSIMEELSVAQIDYVGIGI